MRYEGSNPSLCTILFLQDVSMLELQVDLSPAGSGRMSIALAVIAVLGVLAWQTMEPGKFRSLTWVLLGFFAFRVVITHLRSR
jgi:hypothetical protein